MHDSQLMLDSIGLRELAEYASGLRRDGGDPAYFTIRAEPDRPGWYRVRHQHTPVVTDPEQIAVPVDTSAVGRNRPVVTQVTVTYLDPTTGLPSQMVLDGSKYDAFFWSEGAVEKFVFPYYASKYQWAAADWLTTMSQAWYGYVPEICPDPSRQDTLEEIIPMGMVHYPRSDYGDVGEGTVTKPGGEMHVLSVADPLPIPLSEYRER